MIYRDLNTINKKYSIIYADPPWEYDDPKGNLPRLGGKTYPVLPLEEIKRLPIGTIVNKDAVLFLWVTMPKLREGLEVIEAWDFKYITCAFTWVKVNKNMSIYSGLGHWTNGNAELCLLGKRGHPQRIRRDVKQVIMAQLREHSRKPDGVRDRIVQLMGDLPRIELFARQYIEGWDVWSIDELQIGF